MCFLIYIIPEKGIRGGVDGNDFNGKKEELQKLTIK